jgi:hypothetical protein
MSEGTESMLTHESVLNPLKHFLQILQNLEYI